MIIIGYMMEKLWIDSIENHICKAMGYSPAGAVYSEQEAKEIVERHGFSLHDGWPIRRNQDVPIYRYYPIALFSEN